MNYYQMLLGIQVAGKRPNYFQLLEISPEEVDPDVIKAAAVGQTKKLRPQAAGPHAEACKRIAAEIKRAYQVLAHDERRQLYIAKLAEARKELVAAKEASQTEPIRDVVDRSIPAGNVKWIVGGVVALLAVTIGLSGYLLWGGKTTWVAVESVRNEQSVGQPMPVPNDTATDETPSAKADPKQVPSSVSSVLPPVESVSDEALNTQKVDDVLVQAQVIVPASDVSTPVAATSVIGEPEVMVVGEPKVVSLAEDSVHAKAALTVLRKHCFSCHGENESDEGGFGFVTAREKLISSGFVVPSNTRDSLLFERMESKESPMPPEGEAPGPTDQDIATVRAWILAGAKPFDDAAEKPTVSPEQMVQLVAKDLASVSKKERVYVRYFSVTHLSNAGYSDEEIGVYQRCIDQTAEQSFVESKTRATTSGSWAGDRVSN